MGIAGSRRRTATEKVAQVDDRQQLAAHVGKARIQVLAPGTRVTLVGTASTSRVSSRATRYSSPAILNATPTHSRPAGFFSRSGSRYSTTAALEFREELEGPVAQRLQRE